MGVLIGKLMMMMLVWLTFRLKQMRLIHNKGYTPDEMEDFRYVR